MVARYGPDQKTVLHLGVIDIPYANPPAEMKKNRTHPAHSPGTETTGDVATWLENKYHVVEVFYSLYEDQIVDDVANAMGDAVDALMSGAPVDSIDPFSPGALSAIQTRFKQFLSNQEIEGLGIPGVPTQAALDGVSHRHKSGFTRGRKRRPSFIDTGLYQASFIAWADSKEWFK